MKKILDEIGRENNVEAPFELYGAGEAVDFLNDD